MNISILEYTSLLSKYLKPQRTKVIMLGLLILISIGLQLASPQIVRLFIDSVASQASVEKLITYGVIFLGAAVGSQIVSIAVTYVGEGIGWTATNTLRADLAEHCIRLDSSFHHGRTPGEMVERIDGDVTVLANFFSQFGVRVLNSILFLIGVLVILFMEHWLIGLVFTVFALISMITLHRVRGLAIPHYGAVREIRATLFGFLEERLSGAEDVKANGAVPYLKQQFFKLLGVQLQKEKKASITGSVSWTSILLFFSIGTAASLVFGAYYFKAGLMSIGTVYMIYSYVQLLRTPVEQITNQIQDLQRVGASVKRIRDILNTQSRLQEGEVCEMSEEAKSITMKHVTFAYGEGEPVLHDVTMRLEAGQVLGILGRTGSGKSTLVRLLLRFYDPLAGTIEIGGQDIRSLTFATLRSRIAIVTQEVQLFTGTIRDNLTFFDEQIEDVAIMHAFRELGLIEWFQSLPQGLDTMLGQNGGGLSAGEAQLLAFTRIFLRNPSIVILDEASARLDPATEQLLSEAVNRLLIDRTGIIIAHRLSTLDRADQIMILDNGYVREIGDRRELKMDENSRYHELLQTGLEGMLA